VCARARARTHTRFSYHWRLGNHIFLPQTGVEWYNLSSGCYARVAIERNLGGSTGSVVCHLTGMDVMPHKATFTSGSHNSDKP
jgi:hypothetical protein